MTTQDFAKGVDFTLVGTIVNGSTLNQHIDLAEPAADKGLVIETEDTDTNTPNVPNPNGTYAGVTPLHWKRYIWKRIKHGVGASIEETLCYIWDESVASDPVYLNWVRLNADVTAVDNKATVALNTANSAYGLASTVDGKVTVAQSDIDTLEAKDVSQDALVASLQAQITALQTQLNSTTFRTGDIKPTFNPNQFSTTVNEGWLLLNGASVSKTIFSGLYAVIGALCTADGPNNFFLPNVGGRALVGAGTGAGLTERILASFFGDETITLALAQVPDNHSHTLGVASSVLPDASPALNQRIKTGGDDIAFISAATAKVARTEANVRVATPHSNIPPSFACYLVIKT